MIFVDTNVVIDVLERDPSWFAWSRERIATAAQAEPLMTSSIVVAECAARFDSLATLVAVFEGLSIKIDDLPLNAAFAAGALFRQYRRDQRERNRILADFLIGAHALQLDATLLTRDATLYSRYFPALKTITPEADPHD